MACASGGKSEGAAVPDQFPVGLRVLVVDDDVVCLRVLEQMLRKCMYNVMSADGRTNLVMRGIRHGACDYLIKPIRDEELKNIWQHVVRKRWTEIKEHDHSGSMEDHDRQKRAVDDAEYASSVNEGADEVLKAQRKRRDSKDEDDTEFENDDPTTAKKSRVVWSVELHQQFVSAVNQLGIDKAVPKRILELMNVPGLTRRMWLVIYRLPVDQKIVLSNRTLAICLKKFYFHSAFKNPDHDLYFVKFRLYLKRLSGVAQQQGVLPAYCGTVEQNLKLASLGRFDIQALVASGQLPPQALAALHAEFLSRPAGNLILPAMDQRTLLHASLQGSKCIPVDRNVAFGQPLMKCSSNITKQTSQSLMSNEDVHSEFAAWSSKHLAETIYNTRTKSPINVQPSCLVVPSQSSPNFQAGNSPVSVNQNRGFRNVAVDHNNPLLQSNNSSGVGQTSEVESKPPCMLSEFGAAGSVSSVPNMNCMQGSYNGKLDMVQGSTRNSIYVGKGTFIPSRFAVDEHEFPVSNVSHQVKHYVQNNANKVKQESNMDLTENLAWHSEAALAALFAPQTTA
ncbi:hypothetical protein DH2020_043816 [Rehmannia glutinosa]|uniref:Response regulatory domain-containing protein n=1 Tax=Rehmannia glutinosa TaxID=99300 RepID=A0ABR0UJT2_REHGL